MDWHTLEGLQDIAADRKIVICAWRPSGMDDLQNKYVWDKEGKAETFKIQEPFSIKVVIEKDGKATIFHPDGTMDLKEHNPSTAPIQGKKEIFHLEMARDRKKNPEKRSYRSMTFEEVKSLNYGDHPLIRLNNGKVGEVKVNGAVRLWKRDPARIEVPCKYGLYECFTFTARDINRFLIEVE